MDNYKFALLGLPLARSKSPELFNVFSKLLSKKLSYSLLETEEKNLHLVINEIADNGFNGFNVTLPYKTKVIPLLNKLSVEAKQCGAVNCVRIVKKDDLYKFEGTNTDAEALLWLLREKLCGGGSECIKLALPWLYNSENKEKAKLLKLKTVLIYGAGGAARASAYAFAKAGFGKIVFYARHFEQAKNLAEYFSVLFSETVFSFTQNISHINAEAIVNATPTGMYGASLPDILGSKTKIVVDWPYIKGKTDLVRKAAYMKICTISGDELLLRQAILSLRFWLGIPLDIVQFRSLAEEAINKAGVFNA